MPQRESESSGRRVISQEWVSPIQVLLGMGLLAGAIFLIDVWTNPAIDVPNLYVFVVLLSLWSPSSFTPFLTGATVVALTFIPPILVWPFSLDWFVLVNRLITSGGLLITAILVSARQTADTELRKGQEELGVRVEERTAELRAVNQALESEIATRRRAEQWLRDNQDRLARTEDFSLVMVTHVGLDGRWMKVPGRLCNLLGYSESELLAGTFMDVTHPDDVEADWSQCQRLIRNDIKSFELEKRYIRKDGEIVWVYLNCSGVYDEEGRLLHFLTYIRDLSDQKRIEQALRQSEAKWHRVIETVPIGIAISTVDGRVLDVNTTAWTMLGYESKEEFLGLAADSHYLNPADRQRHIERMRSGKRVLDVQFKKKDGTTLWGRWTAAILEEPNSEPLLINACEDITAQREYHETLQQTEEDLQSANQRLTERDHVRTKFISVVSHELRTPIAAIKGFIDNMLNGVTGDLNERQTNYLRRMQNSLERLTRLIGQLLDWSGLDMGKAPLLLKSVSPADLLRAVVDNARAVAEPKQILVTTEIEDNLPAILADPDKLEQVLWNLIGNAIKFSQPSGTVKIECRTPADGGILFTVSDTGCGIAPDDIPKVFEQFSGVQGQMPSAKGAQLGLYITKSLVLLHGGQIWVESKIGEGSRFFVYLPLNQTERPIE